MIIEVKDGCYGYQKDKQVLRGVNLRLEERQILTILGQNGIGKTTLLKCLMGIYRWQSGETYMNGEQVRSLLDTKRVGYVPQAHAISFAYTVEELVSMGRAKFIRAMAVPSRKDMAYVGEALETVGIADLRRRKCNELSGGQLQLAFIARALAGQPEVLVLDEPESHLDFKNQFIVLNLLQRLVRERGLSCILNTHFPEHALRISDKTLLLGQDTYLFGDTPSVITEENVAAYFGVRAKIFSLGADEQNLPVFTVLEELREKG